MLRFLISGPTQKKENVQKALVFAICDVFWGVFLQDHPRPQKVSPAGGLQPQPSPGDAGGSEMFRAWELWGC